MRTAPRHSAGLTSLTVGGTEPKFLQDFLAARFSLTRRSAKAVIDGRNVWVNRKCVWIARYSLRNGDLVEIPTAVVKAAQRATERVVDRRAKDDGTSGGPEPRPRSKTDGVREGVPQRSQFSQIPQKHIRILWQNDNYLVCDKPAGLLSCEGPRSVEAILREQEKLPNLEAVHRLDRDTTGCLMFAKCHAAQLAAIDLFRTHKVTKTYHAIVVGKFKYAKTRIDAPLDGENAITNVSREAMGDDASFLRIKIETGRTNQIRRHLSSLRAPIVGDRVFGLKSVRDARFMQVPRQMLHASTLEMPEPMAKGAFIKVHSPLPADFRSALKAFGMGK